MTRIKIESKDIKVELQVTPVDSAATRKISASLPLESRARLWGDEIYFDTDISAPAQGATLDVGVGDIAYWPEGKCLCIFFGKTPASSGDRPVPASEVVIVGKADVDPAMLRRVKPGSKVRVE